MTWSFIVTVATLQTSNKLIKYNNMDKNTNKINAGSNNPDSKHDSKMPKSDSESIKKHTNTQAK